VSASVAQPTRPGSVPAMTLTFGDPADNEPAAIEGQSSHMNVLPKAVVYSAMLAIAAAIAAQPGTSSASVADTATLVNLATDNALSLCGQIDYAGSNVSADVEVKANAMLPRLLKKIGADVSGSASVGVHGSRYSGVAQKDLAAAIYNKDQCKLQAEQYLLDAMKQSLAPPPAAPSQTTKVSVKTGEVTQNQNLAVSIDNHPSEIPGFTIEAQPFSFNPRYEVTPHPLATSRASEVAPTLPACRDAGRINPGDTLPTELIVGRSRCVGIGAEVTFLGEVEERGHVRAVLRSEELWTTGNQVQRPDSAAHIYNAILVTEGGEPIYVRAAGVEYTLSLGKSRQPEDGSEIRIMVTLSRGAL
jgi:hypothetical protein